MIIHVEKSDRSGWEKNFHLKKMLEEDEKLLCPATTLQYPNINFLFNYQ
jgi:hypothetical protein